MMWVTKPLTAMQESIICTMAWLSSSQSKSMAAVHCSYESGGLPSKFGMSIGSEGLRQTRDIGENLQTSHHHSHILERNFLSIEWLENFPRGGCQTPHKAVTSKKSEAGASHSPDITCSIDSYRFRGCVANMRNSAPSCASLLMRDKKSSSPWGCRVLVVRVGIQPLVNLQSTPLYVLVQLVRRIR